MLIKSYSEIVRSQDQNKELICSEMKEEKKINPNILNGESSRQVGDKFEVEVLYELLSNITNRKRPSMVKKNKMTKKAQSSTSLILKHVPFKPKKVHYYQSKCGKEGLPWDIALISDKKTMNISLKHRNCKIKHQRPFSTPKQTKDPNNGSEFQKRYNKIKETFLSCISTEKTYSKVRNNYPNLIEENLYSPICKLVAEYLNSLPLNCIHHYFHFLMGVGPGYILSCYDDKVFLYSNKSIIHFKLVKFNARAKGKYIYLQFIDENNKIIRLTSRIHNSSKNILSRNNRLGLKMDTSVEKKNMAKTFDLIGVSKLAKKSKYRQL